MIREFLLSSGYARLSNQNKSAIAFLDVGPIGPNYLPGHGHADTLSFELSIHGKRVVVNAGTSQPMRKDLNDNLKEAHLPIALCKLIT